jgi:hypothetical protein
MKDRTQTYMTVGVVAALAFSTMACGSLETALDTTEATGASTSASANDAMAASAASQLFGSSTSANLAASKVLLVKSTDSRSESYSTCDEALSDTAGPDAGTVKIGSYSAPGAYGSLNYLNQLEADGSCALEDGSANPATDQSSLVASFELVGTVDGSCTEDDGVTTIAMLPGSTGIWRNTQEYSPQIWGTFNFLINGTREITLDCTIFLGEGEEVLFADCTNDSGTVVAQDTSASCSIESGADSGADRAESQHSEEHDERHDDEDVAQGEEYPNPQKLEEYPNPQK